MTPSTPPPAAPMRRPLRTPGPTEAPRAGAAVEVAAPACPIWWSLSDVARALAYSERQVRRLCATAKLPYSRVGRMLRFEPEAVRAWTRRFVVQGAGR